MCLLFAGCSETKPEAQEEEVVSREDKNKEAVRAVLESQLTVPNEDYIKIQKGIIKKMDAIQESLPEGSSFGLPEDSAEWLAYEELVRKTFGPYFMDYAYDSLIPTNEAFQFHFGTELEEVRYQMKVNDIQVTQSDNKNTPKQYDFIAQIEYTSNIGDVSQHEVKGVSILSEIGKIGKFTITDVDGLSEKISEDKGETSASTENKNQEAIRAVLKSEFTVPNAEYVLIVKNIARKMTEIGSSTPEANFVNGVEETGVSDEWLAYEDLVKKTYGPYFTDHLYEYLISNVIAFRYHYGYLGFDENTRYKLEVKDIQVAQSVNKNTPKQYDFTVQVIYTSNTGEVSQHEVKGRTILSEPGKIGKFEIPDDSGLQEKVSGDR